MSKLDDATESMFRNLAQQTGKSLDEWIAIVTAAGHDKHMAAVNWLKAEHGLGHGYANSIVLAARGHGETDDDTLLAAQYAGTKAALRPIYDALIDAARRFGDDIEIAPKKAYVSLRRAKQFALLQPSTATRLDVGLNLKGLDTTARLEASGSFNAMCSHRVRLGSAAEVDDELIAWLRQAYASAG